MTKCLGCGAILQDQNIDLIGYTKNIDAGLCLRCFRIKNYNDYKVVLKDNNDYIDILKQIDKTDDLVLLVVDIFDFPNKLDDIRKYLHNDLILVITKRDILPKSVYDENLLNYFSKYNLNIKASIIISSKNNYHFDELYSLINEHKKGKNVYVVGYTNAGKSSLINKIIYNYSDIEHEVTVSSMPSTTIDTIELKINEELTLIDTPGLLNEGSIMNVVDGKMIKTISPRKEIKPVVYQLKTHQYIFINDFLKIDAEKVNLVLYFANDLKKERLYSDKKNKKYLKEYSFEVSKGEDIVISGLGFIKVSNNCIINIAIDYDINIYKRDSLI